jgi:hypothetical protein
MRLHIRRRAPKDSIGGLDRFLIGVSDRVDKGKIERRNPTAVLQQTLDAAGLGSPTLVTSWTTWDREIGTSQPQVLVLLTHSEHGTLELGASDLFDSTNMWTGLIRQPPANSPAGPIVVLAGCETGVTTGLSSFAELFRSFGASVVIGTNGTTLGRFAAPIAAELLAVLNDPDGPPTIGGALLEVRRRTLGRGWVTGLLMMAFTDGAYVLARGR